MSVYVRLRIGSEAYAIPVEHVAQVGRLGDVTPVPGSLPELLGIRNLRGQILPILDLAMLLGVSRIAPATHMIVGEAGGRQAGFAIDEVSQVGELADPTEETESDLLVGATLADGDLIGVIDVARVLEAVGGARH